LKTFFPEEFVVPRVFLFQSVNAIGIGRGMEMTARHVSNNEM